MSKRLVGTASAAQVEQINAAGGNEWTSIKAPDSQGPLVIVSASKLAEEGTTGVVAEGTFEKSEPNKFNETKNDYFIRGADNTLYIVRGTSGLQEQMNELKGLEGAKVRLIYNGKIATKSGRGFHSFDVQLAK